MYDGDNLDAVLIRYNEDGTLDETFDGDSGTGDGIVRYDYGGSADVDRYKYGYDRASNRTYRENALTSGKDEFYTYDGMYRLKNFDRGDLNAGKTAISGTPRS